MSAAIIPVVVAGLVSGAPDLIGYSLQQTTDVAHLGPIGFVYTNLSLIALIPASMLSIWAVYGVRPRFLASVRGGIRWAWMLRCAAVVVPLWLVYVGITVLVGPSFSPRPPHWVALLVIVVLMTPLQAAGEEYLFRGWVLQNVGSWFAQPMVGLGVSLVVSAVAFSAAHLSPDPFVVGTLACLAITAGIATWRTGGLEAGIVIHGVNNILSFFIVILFGGWERAFVTSTTKAPPATLVLAIVIDTIALALVFWQARRVGISNRYAPAVRPPAAYPPTSPLPAR
jgi:membrane protease YdiL (CAAX protease family)